MSNLSGSNQPPIPPDDAENLLNRLFNDFWMIVGAAWQSWENLPALERMKLDARARAACINRFIVFEAKLHFSKVNGVNVVERRGMFLLSVEGRVLLRFKKLREDKKTSNVPTRQQKLFSTHKELPEMPPHAAYLTVGYMLNITETGIEAVLVTCQNGSQLQWYIDVPRPAKPKIVPIIAANSGTKPKPNVRPRMADNKKVVDNKSQSTDEQ